jgi:cytochrome c oxidase assembly protein subunit 11
MRSMEKSRSLVRALNLNLMGKLLVVTAVMFCFGYGLVPLYKKICEVTGINVLTGVDPGAKTFAANTQVDTSRSITVEFDSNSRGPWHFKPIRNSMQVHPGQLNTIVYEIANQENRSMQAQAIPSYAPAQAMPYFRKLECFCFKQQALGAHQARQFPVVFIDPKLPANVKTITLSYTFFEIAGSTAAVRASGRANDVRDAVRAPSPLGG